MSSVTAEGLCWLASVSAPAPMRGHEALEALAARRVQQEAGEGQVVLHDQQHQVALLDVVAVVVGDVVGREPVLRLQRQVDAGVGRLLRRRAAAWPAVPAAARQR